MFTVAVETHHIEWLTDGGADDLNNLLTLCKRCHKLAPAGPKFLEFQQQGGGLWPEIRRRMFEMLISDPDLKELTVNDVDTIVKHARKHLYMRCSLWDYDLNEESEETARLQEVIRQYHARVSKDRLRFYGEPLPPLEVVAPKWWPELYRDPLGLLTWASAAS